MVDVDSGAAAVPAKTPTASPVSGTAPAELEKKFVTVEQFQEVVRRLDGMSGSLRKLEPLTTLTAPPQPQKEPDTLKSLREQIDAREAKALQRERVTALADSLEAAGVPQGRRSKAVKYILAEHGQKMIQDDDGNFQYVENGEKQKLSDWVTLYMRTDDGKFINPEPAPLVPAGKGLTGSAASPGSSTGFPGSKMTYKELLKPENVLIATELRREHPEIWEAKREEGYNRARKAE